MRKSIYEIAADAEPALRRIRQGLSLVRQPVCPPPCHTTIVRGICPKCQRPISLKLGLPRSTAPVVQSASLANIIGLEDLAIRTA